MQMNMEKICKKIRCDVAESVGLALLWALMVIIMES